MTATTDRRCHGLTQLARTAGIRSLSMGLLALAVAIIMTGPSMAQDLKPSDRTMQISASGRAVAEPDMATISTGVLSEAETAKDALAANTTTMNKVMEALHAAGLEPRDIQTSDFSVQPKYQYYQDNTPPKMIGYTVANQVFIRVRDLKKLGAVLDRVVEMGSNQVSGIQFELSTAATMRNDARKQAIANAIDIARLYAEAAGVSLGPILRIEEAPQYSGPVANYRAAADVAAASPVPIAAGVSAIEVQVMVTWALK